jgi:hypothetical protein
MPGGTEDNHENFQSVYLVFLPITVAARSKARNVFPRTNTGIVGSNPIRETFMFLCVYSMFVLSCVGSGLATG